METKARMIRLRRYSTCASCRRRMPTGWRAHYLPARREVRCLTCGPPAGPDRTGARLECRDCGRSVWHEAEVAAVVDGEVQCFECAAIDAHHVLGEAPSGAERGDGGSADGATRREVRLGRRLTGIAGPEIVVLHERALPSRRTTIDHLVVTPSSVWVIGAQRHARRAGADSQGMGERVVRQAEAVASLLAPLGEELDEPISVRPALVFVGPAARWRSHESGGVWTGAGRPLFKRLRAEAPGPLRVDVVAKRLARELPAG